MNVMATTLPRSALSEARWPSWFVSVNSGAGPILGRVSPSAAASTPVSRAVANRTMRIAMPFAHRTLPTYAFSSFFNSLRKRQSVPWAMTF